MSDLESIVTQLQSIEEQLRDLAYDALRSRVNDDNAGVRALEKRYEQARRAVEKAARVLSDAGSGLAGEDDRAFSPD